MAYPDIIKLHYCGSKNEKFLTQTVGRNQTCLILRPSVRRSDEAFTRYDRRTDQSDRPVGLTIGTPINRALLTMALISGADVSMPAFELQDDSFNIHRDIN